MKKIIVLVFTVFLTFNLYSNDLQNTLSRFVNKNVEIHYSLGGSASGYKAKGVIEEITTHGVYIKVKNEIMFINFDYIVSITNK